MTATVFLALLASHLLGDWVVQTDEQAANKTRAWSALLGHVARYHLIMGGLLLIPVLRDGWPLWRALLTLAVSAGSHAFIDRRWPVRRLLVAVGQPRLRHRRVGRDRRRPGPAPVHPGDAGRGPHHLSG